MSDVAWKDRPSFTYRKHDLMNVTNFDDSPRFKLKSNYGYEKIAQIPATESMISWVQSTLTIVQSAI